jgi:hypothetical protein
VKARRRISLSLEIAGAGGGISNGGSSLALFNTTVADNTAATDGGGVQNAAAGINSLSSTTVAGNSSSDGGGLSSGGAGSVQLKNSILSDNTASVSGDDCSGTVVSLDNNVIEETSGCTVTLAANDINADAALDAFVPDGPGGAHYPLTEISPAINAADDTACTASDQIDQARVGPCDIGAIEYPLPVQDTNELDVEKSKFTFYYQEDPPVSDSITMSGFLRFPALPAYTHPFGQDVSVSVAVGYTDPSDPENTIYVPIYELDGIRDDTPAPAYIARDRDNGLKILRFFAPQPPANPTRSKVRLEIEKQQFQEMLKAALPTAETYLERVESITKFSFEIKFEDGRVWSSSGPLILLDFNEKKLVLGKEK